jgi:hypothetical protein
MMSYKSEAGELVSAEHPGSDALNFLVNAAIAG